jgi:acyl-coenzyme A synthetase/AMP-(fatty) acid ligase
MPAMADFAAARERHLRRMKAFRWELPPRFNFARDVVGRHAQDPERPALLWRNAAGAERRFRYADLAREAHRVAHALRRADIARADPVLVLLPRIPEWHLAMIGALEAGALVIPCATMLRPKDIRYRVRHSAARALLVGAGQTAAVDAVRSELPSVRHFFVLRDDDEALPPGWQDWRATCAAAPDDASAQADTAASDPALVYYTSGTTGPPKAVLHAHAWTWAQRYTALHWMGLRPDDRVWTTSDTGWAKAAYSVLFGPFSVGAEVFLYDGRFEARRELELLADIAPQVFCAPPTEFRLLVKEPLAEFSFPNLREVVSAGEPLNPEVIRAFHDATGLTIRDGYGQTETILLIGNAPGVPVKPGAMGLPTPGHHVEIIDEQGQPLPVGEVGDVALSGDPPSLFRGYWKDEEATRRCRRGDWYVTGDRAFRDADGWLWFVARADDVIISAGYRIGPFEVESALLEHPDVLEAAVVAAPDAERGAIVKAVVVLRPGVVGDDALARALQEHVKRVTAPYKYPRAIEFVDALPKTVSGKIRRVELRRSASEGEPQDPPRSGR